MFGNKGKKDKVGFWDRLIGKKQENIEAYQKIKAESSDIVTKALQDRKIQEARQSIEEDRQNKAKRGF